MQEASKISILIVDDDDALRSAIAFDFKRKGYVVLEASGGRHALELVKENKFDIVITDIRMPDGDGVELLKGIKALNPKTPAVIFMTGFTELTTLEAYDRGVDAVFFKPFDRKALFASIDRIVRDQRGKWSGLRNSPRVTAKYELVLSSFKEAGKCRLINIGQGGMFVACEGEFPIVSSVVQFSVNFDDEYPSKFSGSGTVRWVRTEDTDSGPAGCGIEFNSMDEQNRIQALNLINLLNTKSSIPEF